jgi:hypothetical protein
MSLESATGDVDVDERSLGDVDRRREPTNERDETHFSEGVGSAFGLLVNEDWSFCGNLRQRTTRSSRSSSP